MPGRFSRIIPPTATPINDMTFDELWQVVERQQEERGREGVSTNAGLRKAMQLAYNEGAEQERLELGKVHNPLDDLLRGFHR